MLKYLETLIDHLRKRNDVQNIDLMNLSGFCRNCLSKWYVSAAEKKKLILNMKKQEKLYMVCLIQNGKKNIKKKLLREQLDKLNKIRLI